MEGHPAFLLPSNAPLVSLSVGYLPKDNPPGCPLPRQPPSPVQHSTPEVPDASCAVLPACVHPAAILMKAHRCDVLINSIITDDGVGVIGVEIIHADMLVTWGHRLN